MRYTLIIALLCLLTFQTTFAQDKGKIRDAAMISATAFVKGDYPTLAAHTYPKFLTMMGGKQKFIQFLNQQMGMMRSQGIAFAKITVGIPGNIYTAGTELHCLVPETLTAKMQNKYVTSTSYLLAISPDKGKTWYFIDTTSCSPQQLKQLLPNYNAKLVIPAPSQPVFSDKMP